MITRAQVLRNARHAGSVVRYHTWKMHQVQTVADHSWNCCRIYFALWGPLPPEISTHFIWHDTGELVLGDLPFPVKAENPELKYICDKIEYNAIVDMGGSPSMLSDRDKVRTKVCDLLDMYELGMVELQMGNRFGQPIVDDIGHSLELLLRKLSAEDVVLVRQYVDAMAKGLLCM